VAEITVVVAGGAVVVAGGAVVVAGGAVVVAGGAVVAVTAATVVDVALRFANWDSSGAEAPHAEPIRRAAKVG